MPNPDPPGEWISSTPRFRDCRALAPRNRLSALRRKASAKVSRGSSHRAQFASAYNSSIRGVCCAEKAAREANAGSGGIGKSGSTAFRCIIAEPGLLVRGRAKNGTLLVTLFFRSRCRIALRHTLFGRPERPASVSDELRLKFRAQVSARHIASRNRRKHERTPQKPEGFLPD